MKAIISSRTMMVMNTSTVRRADVIYKRTNNLIMGICKAQMIDLLKVKLSSGVAHFIYMKKDGSVREAWGTTVSNLMKANINSRGISRDSVNCVAYFDVEAGGFRSLRFENLIRVF